MKSKRHIQQALAFYFQAPASKKKRQNQREGNKKVLYFEDWDKRRLSGFLKKHKEVNNVDF